jgi:hypothetical protein
MINRIRTLILLFLAIGISSGVAADRTDAIANGYCTICYTTSFLFWHWTTWDTLPGSCEDYILDPESDAVCDEEAINAPPIPGRYKSNYAFLDGSGVLLDSLVTPGGTGKVLATRDLGRIVIRPNQFNPSQLEFASLPGSPYPASSLVVYSCTLPGRPVSYPPLLSLHGQVGPMCSPPAGTEFCLAYTQLTSTTHTVVANQMYPIDLQALTYSPVADVPSVGVVGRSALALALIGGGVFFITRRKKVASSAQAV